MVLVPSSGKVTEVKAPKESGNLHYILRWIGPRSVNVVFKIIRSLLSVAFIPEKIVKSKFPFFCLSVVNLLQYFYDVCFPFGCSHHNNFDRTKCLTEIEGANSHLHLRNGISIFRVKTWHNLYMQRPLKGVKQSPVYKTTKYKYKTNNVDSLNKPWCATMNRCSSWTGDPVFISVIGFWLLRRVFNYERNSNRQVL